MCSERVCEKCGGPNPNWFSPEFVSIVGSRSGVICPTCFTGLDTTGGTWMVTRIARDEDQARLLADVLRGCTADPDDADRVARCIIDAGWRSPQELAQVEWEANNLAWALRRADREHTR